MTTLSEWIEREFTGYGVAVRRERDASIPGEPLMSMAVAKDLARRAVKEFSPELPAGGHFKPGDKVSTGHTLKRRVKKSPHPSCVVNDTDCRAWEYEGGGWDYESSFISAALPAPAEHEAVIHIDRRLVDLREANEILKKASWDRSSDILRNDREIRWLIDFRTVLRLPAPHAEVREALRLLRKIADLVDDEEAAEPLDDAIRYANEAIAALSPPSERETAK